MAILQVVLCTVGTVKMEGQGPHGIVYAVETDRERPVCASLSATTHRFSSDPGKNAPHRGRAAAPFKHGMAPTLVRASPMLALTGWRRLAGSTSVDRPDLGH